jgi:hypothetical protein
VNSALLLLSIVLVVSIGVPVNEINRESEQRAEAKANDRNHNDNAVSDLIHQGRP